MGATVKKTSSSGRRRRHGGRHQTVSEINVTPLVDVMLVLLIVFMVSAPLMTTGVSINLPQTAAKALNTDNKQEPVTVTVDHDGNLFMKKDPVTIEALLAFLDQEVSTQGGVTEKKQQQIFIRADEGVAYGQVMSVMGELSRAGYARLSLISQPLEQ